MITPYQAHPLEASRLLLNSAHRDWWGQGVDMVSEETILCALFRLLWPLHTAAELPCWSALVAVRICPSKVAQTRPQFFSPYFTLMNFLCSCWQALDSVNKVTYGFQAHLVFGWGENKLHEHLPYRVTYLKYLHEYLFCRSQFTIKSFTIKWISDMSQPLLFKSDDTRQQKEQIPA